MHSNIYLEVKDHCNLNETLLCRCLALQKCDLVWHHRAKLELTASASERGCWSGSVMGFLKCISTMLYSGFIHSWCYSCSQAWSSWEIRRTKGEKKVKREIPFCALGDLCAQSKPTLSQASACCLKSWQVHLECLQECWNSVSLKCESVVWWWEIYEGEFMCLMLKYLLKTMENCIMTLTNFPCL